MGERKGVNKYYPPDFDPAKHRNLDKYHNTHPLRERAKKIHLGILVIRYEMPYNVWCEGCGNHIGMGVRYNAEKKKVGNYYTTPIYQFKMKCHLCDNYLVMETDPKNCEYKCISGVKRKNQKWDMKDNEQVVPEDKEDVKKRAADAMYKLEHGVEDKKKSTLVIPTLGQLVDKQSGWQMDYDQNAQLRKKFRHEKKDIQASKLIDDKLLAKSSLNITLIPETEEDKQLASLMKYNVVQSFDEKQSLKRESIESRPLFSLEREQDAMKSPRTHSLVDRLNRNSLKTVSFTAKNHKTLDFGIRQKRTKTNPVKGTNNTWPTDLAINVQEVVTENDKERKCVESRVVELEVNNGVKFDGRTKPFLETHVNDNQNAISAENNCSKRCTEEHNQTNVSNMNVLGETKHQSELGCLKTTRDNDNNIKQNKTRDNDNDNNIKQNKTGVLLLCNYGSSSGDDD